jgi:4-diphosphocytidyl-2-C-methyl-D-erythritol kinase
MLVFPNAKINLGLNIISKRPDGYHELETCFMPVPWKDVLEIVPSKKLEFHSTGIEIPGDGSNIVLQAYHLLAEDFDLVPVKIHLHKIIPIGAGLGGGSADAAFALKLYNDYFKLGLNDDQLMAYAVKLGADCAFFIKNKPMMAKGIGEELSDIALDLSGKSMMLVYPNIHISTGEAYSSIVPKKPAQSIRHIISAPIQAWKESLINDFERPLFQSYPVLKEIKEKLYKSGALYAAMSGSGSTIFGIFETPPSVTINANYLTFSGQL